MTQNPAPIKRIHFDDLLSGDKSKSPTGKIVSKDGLQMAVRQAPARTKWA